MSDMTSVARCVLNAAKALDPNAIIAGGFARDTKLGRTPKDIDVYVQFEPILSSRTAGQHLQLREMAGAIAWGLKGAGLEVKDLGEALREEYGNRLRPLRGRPAAGRPSPNVAKLSVDGHAVDLIAVRNSGMNHVWSTFDIGLCMVAISDDTMEIHTDPRHDSDLENKTLTLYFDQVTDNDRRIKSIDHAKRLLEKYKGFEVKVEL